MNPRAIKADFLYTLRAWYRSPSRVFMSVVFPTILLLVLGFAFGAEPDTRPRLDVEDADGTTESQALVAMLRQSDALDVRVVEAGAEPETPTVAFLRIPEGFGQEVGTGRNATVILTLGADGAQPSAVVQRLVESSVAAFNAVVSPPPQSIAVATAKSSAPIPSSYRDFLLPGVLGMNVAAIGLFTAFGFSTQLRSQGLLARLAVSPMTKADWLVGRMLGMTIVSLLSCLVVAAVGVVALGVPFPASPWTWACVATGTLLFAGLGSLLAGIFRNADVGAAVLQLVYLPMVLLSGSFFRTSALPEALRRLPEFLPLTYLNDGLRAAALDASGFAAAWNVLVLLGAAIAVVLVGSKLMNWRAA